MTEIYSFIFCIGLGIVARLIYLAASKLAEKTDLFPLTVMLDVAVAAMVGGAFIAFVIATSAVIAPYMFASLAAGYLAAFSLTKNIKLPPSNPRRHSRASSKKSERRPTGV